MNNSVISAPEMTAPILHNRATEQSGFQLSGAQSGDGRINLAKPFYDSVSEETL
jgi:hypothetical protein